MCLYNQILIRHTYILTNIAEAYEPGAGDLELRNDLGNFVFRFSN